MSDIAIGQRILRRRRKLELSQTAVAQRAQIHSPRLCRIEKGKAIPSESEVARIAQAMGLSMQEFYGPLEETPAEETT